MLLKTGEVSRNICIRELYITRLSDIIFKLKAEGWELEGKDVPYEKGLDYVYYLVKAPFKKEQFKNPIDGSIITRYIK